MALTAIQKAALLLTSLDPATAAELLKATRPETVTQIAAELVYMDASGQERREPPTQPLQEFLGLLHSSKSGSDLEIFVRKVLAGTVGEQRTREVLGEVRRLVDTRDPFIPIRGADVPSLAQALRGEHPQVAAVVLMELPPEKSAQLIPLLDESVRGEAVRRMTGGEAVLPEARARVAAMLRKRLGQLRVTGVDQVAGEPSRRLRRVALLLRGLKRELRDSLVEVIARHDADTGTAVLNMMVLWEDIPVINDRSLQDTLRNVDARKLALALVKADPEITRKIRANISERAVALIDEETSLMKAPKPEEIEAARETILGYLREMNAAGELQFQET